MKRSSIFTVIVISLLLLGLGVTTTLAVRYWNEISKLSNVTINIGTDQQVEMTVQKTGAEFIGTLVPEGFDFFDGEVDEVEFEFVVSIDKKLIQTMNLVIEVLDRTIDGSTEYGHLVEVTIEDEVGRKVVDFFNETIEDTVTVKITVKLLEPVDASEAAETDKIANVDDGELAFNTIKGKEIAFSLRFTIEPKN